MKKLKGILVLILLVALLASPIAVIASNIDNALYYGTIIVSNNSTSTTNVAVNCTISTPALIDGGYLNSSANNCAVQNTSGNDIPFMPGANTSYPWCFWVPAIGQDSHLSYLLYTANSTGGEIRYFPGDNMTSLDNDATLELGDNFTVEQKGWLDTDNATAKNLVYKEGAFRTYVDPLSSGNITSQVADSIGGLIPGSGIALDFVRANSDWVSIPDHADLDFTDGAGADKPATVIVWVNMDDATDGHFIAKNTGANDYTWRFRTSGELLEFACFKDDATKYIGRRSPAVTGYEGLWTHFAATYSASETSAGINLYINGVDADDADFELLVYAGMSDTASVVELGSNEAGTAQFLDGIMASAKIYTAELTPDEILADYNGIHRSANLEAWYIIDEGTGNPTDSSGNGHHATANLADWIAATSVTATGVTSEEHTVTTRQTVNLLLTNPDFEDGGTPPTGWTLVGAAAASTTDTATKRINASSANLTRNGADCYLFQDLADFASYRGKEVNFGCWVLSTSGATFLRINDGIGQADSPAHTNSGEWEWLTATYTVDTGAGLLRLFLFHTTTDITVYFDAAVLVGGSDFNDFEGNMLSNWSFELGDPPNDWVGNATVDSQEGTIVKIDSFSFKSVANGGNAYVIQNIPNFAYYQGKTVILGLWYYAPSANDKPQRLQIYDGIDTQPSDILAKDDTWHWQTLSHNVNAGATQLRIMFAVNYAGGADIDDILYVDGAIVVEGTTTPLNVTRRIDHLQILVDDVWQDSAGAASVPDNANDWIFLQNDVMLYMEYQTIHRGPNLRQSIEWEYDDTTFTDLSGNNNDAYPLFRTSTSDPDVSAVFASFLPVEEAKAPAYALEDAPAFIETVPSIISNFDTTPGTGGFPLADVITAVANATATPPQLPLLIIACIFIFGISFWISATLRRYGSGSLIIKIIAITACMGIFIAFKNFGIDFWMLVIFLMISVALAMASRQATWN